MNTNEVKIEQGTIEWKEWRSKGIGGTDAAGVAGGSHYLTPLKIYVQKLGLEPKNTVKSDIQEWGNRIEPLLVDKFMEMHPDFRDCTRGRLYSLCGDYEWCHCSLDAQCVDENGEPVIIECKTCTSLDEWEPVPDGYYAQVQWQMGITGIRRTFFSAIEMGSRRWIEREVRFNQSYFDDLLAKCEDLWVNHILKGVPPEPVVCLPDVDKDAMDAMYTATHDECQADDVELSEDELDKLKVLKESMEAAEEKYKIYVNSLMFRVGNGNATFKGKKVGYHVSRKGTTSVDSSRLKNEYPDIYNKVLKTGSPTSYMVWKV